MSTSTQTGPSPVMLVDDDVYSRFMMSEIIRTLEVNVVVAKDGAEAVSLFRDAHDPFGVILMDMHMPNQSGIETAQQIRGLEQERSSKVPIVAVTADVSFKSDALVEAYQLDGVVSKPVTAGNLLRLIELYCCQHPSGSATKG